MNRASKTRILFLYYSFDVQEFQPKMAQIENRDGRQATNAWLQDQLNHNQFTGRTAAWAVARRRQSGF